MLKVIRKSARRVDIELKGEVSSEEMAKGLDDLIAKSADVENGKMLYRISSFAMPSLGAFGVEFARLPQLLGLLGKYDRCAVMTDVQWLRTAAEVEGAFIPGLAVKSFALDEPDAAEAWLEAG